MLPEHAELALAPHQVDGSPGLAAILDGLGEATRPAGARKAGVDVVLGHLPRRPEQLKIRSCSGVPHAALTFTMSMGESAV